MGFKPHRVISLNEAIMFLEQELTIRGFHPSKEVVQKILDIYLKDGNVKDKRFLTKAVINVSNLYVIFF